MKLVTFLDGGVERVGALVDGGLLDLAAAATRLGTSLPSDMQALIEAGPSAWEAARFCVFAAPDECLRMGVPLLAPLPRPVRLRDASLFLEHMRKALAKMERRMSPEFERQIIYYNADNVHVFGHDQDVPWPTRSSWVDYELEWACIVGHAGQDIERNVATDHIFGVTIFNDWSARDLQFAFMDAGLGPGGGKDFANSLGPCIVTLDEFRDIYDLRMEARVNGETWSSGTTASMHYSFEDAIVQLSIDRPLIPGEVIGSGTVLGGCGLELDRRLSKGDVVELEVEGIGSLRNRLIGSKSPFRQLRGG